MNINPTQPAYPSCTLSEVGQTRRQGREIPTHPLTPLRKSPHRNDGIEDLGTGKEEEKFKELIPNWQAQQQWRRL